MAVVQQTYTQTIHGTTINKQYVEQHKNWEECGPCPVFAGFTLALALQLRKKHGMGVEAKSLRNVSDEKYYRKNQQDTTA